MFDSLLQDALCVQRLKSVMLFKDKSDWSSEINAVTAILEFLSEVNVNQSTVWSGNVRILLFSFYLFLAHLGTW